MLRYLGLEHGQNEKYGLWLGEEGLRQVDILGLIEAVLQFLHDCN